MLRLSPPGQKRILQSDSFDAVYGGGEANVAVSLAQYGHAVSFVTALPDNELGQAAENSLRRFGVDTRFCLRKKGGRLGIYFLENGSSVRPSKVVYDRSRSAIAEAGIDEFNFSEIFDGADWFHFTGITPALSPKSARLTETAVKEAKRKGLKVSVDLNYRKKLWSPARARSFMKPLMQYVDLCIGNEEDAQKVLGLKTPETDVSKGHLSRENYEKICRQMKESFGFSGIAVSLRESLSASRNGWSALLYDGQSFYFSDKYDLQITDRVGAGDSFAAGLIHGFLSEKTPEERIRFAVAASALKHTIPGDYNLVSAEEVEKLAAGDGSGRVER